MWRVTSLYLFTVVASLTHDLDMRLMINLPSAVVLMFGTVHERASCSEHVSRLTCGGGPSVNFCNRLFDWFECSCFVFLITTSVV